MNFCNQSYKQPCDFLTAQSGVEQLDDPKEDHSDGVFGVDENYYSSPEVSNACHFWFNDEQMIGEIQQVLLCIVQSLCVCLLTVPIQAVTQG